MDIQVLVFEPLQYRFALGLGETPPLSQTGTLQDCPVFDFVQLALSLDQFSVSF